MKIIALIVLFSVSSAYACRCVTPKTPELALDQISRVHGIAVLAEVTAVRLEDYYYILTMRVQDSTTIDVAEITVRSHTSGAACGRKFKVGDSDVYYLNRYDKDPVNWYVFSSCNQPRVDLEPEAHMRKLHCHRGYSEGKCSQHRRTETQVDN